MAREMKNSGVSWIGVMPIQWALHRMKSCVEERTSGAWGNEATNDDGDMICLRIADFDYSKFRFKEIPLDGLTIRNYDNESIKKLILKKGDILIEKSGGGEKTPVGRTVIFDKDYPALYANFMDRIRCSDLVTSVWLQYVLVTFYMNGYSKNYIKQTTGIQNLDLTSMLACERIPVPSLEEQNKIASFLDAECARIDSVIEQTRASIEEYKKLKQAVITRAVTKGIRPDRAMKDSGIEWIGEIPEEWDARPLKTYIDILPGYAFSSNDFAIESGIPLLRGINVTPNGIRWDESVYWNQPITPQLKPFELREKDLVVGLDRPWIAEGTRVAFVAKKDLPCLLLQRVCRIRARDNMDIRFVYHSISGKMFEEALSTETTGVSVPHISTKQIENFIVAIPPLQEQIFVCNYLDRKTAEIEALIDEKRRLLIELDNYKKSIIYEYVTGKREVPA